MAVKLKDRVVRLKNKQTGEIYWVHKNGRKVPVALEFKKYSKLLRKHVTFKEAKK